MRCREHNAPWHPTIVVINGIHSVMLQLRCTECSEWLALGQSNDDSDAVRVEIRAAELAVFADENPKRFGREHSTVISNVGRGWWVHQMDLVAADEVTHHPDGLAGYLARAIVTHSEPT